MYTHTHIFKSVPGTNSLILEYIQFQYQLHKIQQHGRNQYVWKQDKCPHCIIKNLVTIPVPFLQRFRWKSLRFSDSCLLTGLESPVTSLTIQSFFLVHSSLRVILIALGLCWETSLECITFSSGTIQVSWICISFTYCSGCLSERNDKERKFAHLGG